MSDIFFSPWFLAVILALAVIAGVDIWAKRFSPSKKNDGDAQRSSTRLSTILAIATLPFVVLGGLANGLDVWTKLGGILNSQETIERTRVAYEPSANSLQEANVPAEQPAPSAGGFIQTAQHPEIELPPPAVQLKATEKQAAPKPRQTKNVEREPATSRTKEAPPVDVAMVQGWPATPPVPAMDIQKASLAVTIKSELKRLNCYRGPDGPDWTEDAVNAVNDFNAYGFRRISAEPSVKALSVLQSFTAPVCP